MIGRRAGVAGAFHSSHPVKLVLSQLLPVLGVGVFVAVSSIAATR